MENKDNIFMILSRLAHVCGYQSMIKMRGTGINPGQAGILFMLMKHGTMSQKDLAKNLHIKAPSVTASLKKMEEGGLIERKVDEEDKRIIRIAITKKGEEHLIELHAMSNEMQELLCKGMTEEEIKIYKRLLVQSFANLTKGNEAQLDEIKKMKEMKGWL